MVDRGRGLAPDALMDPSQVGPGDAQLLDRFVQTGDQAAFALLVRRHGPMVLAVCQRILGSTHDAEDAFQATFLVLVRKAATLRRPELLAGWLHGVAYRVARKNRERSARRDQHERLVVVPDPADPVDELAWRELRAVLDEELHQLPAKYRAPLVLCYLEGKSNAEAARQLGWPVGSMSARLRRGRDLLRERLESRATPGGALLVPAIFSTGTGELPGNLLDGLLKAVGKLTSPPGPPVAGPQGWTAWVAAMLLLLGAIGGGLYAHQRMSAAEESAQSSQSEKAAGKGGCCRCKAQ